MAVCTNCVTGLEAAILASSGIAVSARDGWRRVRSGLAGESRLERRQQIHRSNASFVASLGLDPEAVLGSAPCATEDGSHAPARAKYAGGARTRCLHPPRHDRPASPGRSRLPPIGLTSPGSGTCSRLASYVALGVWFRSAVLNWVVGPLWFFVTLSLVPAALRRLTVGRAGRP